jgi:GT2 family glycosyltransferase
MQKQGAPALRYFRKEPEGPGAARNRGIHEAAGDYVVIMDSDVTLEPEWLRRAAEALDADDTLGMVGGRIVFAHDTAHLNAYGGCLSPIGLAWDHSEGAPVESASAPGSRLWINCSALMARTDVMRELGGFDSVYFYGYEDSDMGWRAAIAGHRVQVIPTLTAYHHVGTEIGMSSATIIFHYSKNRFRSLLKNWGMGRIIRYVPPYLAYALVDAVARRPHGAKFAAVWWNVRMLGDTLRLRRLVQASRKVSDAELAPLFERAWFPPTRLAGRRRRPAAESFSVQAGTSASNHDDRVR